MIQKEHARHPVKKKNLKGFFFPLAVVALDGVGDVGQRGGGVPLAVCCLLFILCCSDTEEMGELAAAKEGEFQRAVHQRLHLVRLLDFF